MIDEASQRAFTEDEWFSVQQAREASSPIPPIVSATMSQRISQEDGVVADIILTHNNGSTTTIENVVIVFENGEYKRHLPKHEVEYLRSLQ